MILFVMIAALIGLPVGALINALADDLPETDRVGLPHYPDGTPRPLIAWSGILAFLTNQQTGPDGQRLAWRQPVTELATTILFGLTAAIYGFSALTIFWLGVEAILILITVIDLEERLILFVVIIPSCIYALIGAVLFNRQISPRITFLDYIIGGVAGFIVFYLIYLGGKLFIRYMSWRRHEKIDETAFGFGDVMLATLSGLILGWQALLYAFYIAVFLGAAGAIGYILVQRAVKGKYELFTPLPYGQYIVFATLLMLLWRAPVNGYLSGF